MRTDTAPHHTMTNPYGLPMGAPTWTPWGGVQDARNRLTSTGPEFPDGCWIVETSSHGGMYLTPAINEQIPEPLRKDSGWYEEDCEIAIPLACLPDLFRGTKSQAQCEQIVKSWFPHEWMTWRGRQLREGESYCYDIELQQLESMRRGTYLTMAAWGDWHAAVPPGYVVVHARVGGRHVRASRKPNGYFLVPASHYSATAPRSFEITPGEYEELDDFDMNAGR